MKRTTWQEIAVDVDRALALCRVLGLGALVERSRFALYGERLRVLIEALEHRGQEGAREAFTADRATHGVALAECSELATLVPFLEAADMAVIRPKLERVLIGPVLPTDEDQNSSIGRNTLFELNLASKLWVAGLRPTLSEHPDLSCEVGSRLLLIECKRPASVGGARKAISKARRQIVRDLKKCPIGSRGVIALSLSKVVNAGDKLLVYRGEAEGREALRAAVDRGREPLADSCHALSDQVMGMIWHIVTPAVDETIPLALVAQETAIEGFIRKGPDDDRELRILYERVRPHFY
jgi:hypothetical protein